MRINTDNFLWAGAKGATNDQRQGTWPVYETFKVIGEGRDLYIYAPLDPPPPPETRTGYFQIGQPDRNRKRMYAPLQDEPDLLLRFADIGRRRLSSEAKALEIMLDWVKTYGTLGLEDAEGRKQSLKGFYTAVAEAEKCLSMHAAATSDAVDREAEIRKVQDLYRPNRPVMQFQKQRDGLNTNFQVMHSVDRVLEQHCYPKLSRISPRPDGTAASFFQIWGFRSLLGAMYLQMMWWITKGSNAPRCKNPGCNNPIRIGEIEGAHEDHETEETGRKSYRTRKDKEFCSRRCKENYRYHNGKKGE